MRTRVATLTLVAALMCCSAAAAAPGPVVTDCNSHGQLTRQYSAVELRQALASLPADVKEYTDCYDVIQRALLAQIGAGGHADGSPAASSGGSGGSFLPTPLIVVLVLLALGGGGLGWVAARRRVR